MDHFLFNKKSAPFLVCVQDITYLQCIVLGDPLHHVGHSGLKDLLECERVHHGEDSGKMLQDFFLLLHANSLTVCHPDVRLLVVGNLNLERKNMTAVTLGCCWNEITVITRALSS